MRSLLNSQGLLQHTLPLLEALERRAQLRHECQNIEAQLRDDNRRQSASTPATYSEWRGRAETKLREFREEQKQLARSIEHRKDVENLLHEAWLLLLDLEKEIVFEPSDNALMRKLAQYFEE